MPTPRKPTSVSWIGVGTLLVLIGGYVGAYYAMVSPELDATLLETEPWYLGNAFAGMDNDGRGQLNCWASRLFAPIYWFDRRIRPHVWELEESTP